MIPKLKILGNLAAAKAQYFLAYLEGIDNDIMSLGDFLMKEGHDEKSDGFWIVEIGKDDEFYSEKFRRSLGFDGEEDFPSKIYSWQKQIDPKSLKKALKMFTDHIQHPDNEYYVPCTYTKKYGSTIDLFCYGSIVNREQAEEEGMPMIMIGTHQIIHK